ncbi:VanZ family protein [Pelagicoccus sp. SDUM812003]|uniref:VanZ family protein n=1 Tax=Pelagicoccus sp. SDUM812003 TaxID=3041267 RepID=UPI00280C6DB6|nr:VanZ family protein [Pelagicoccus sp. SDUM812003]MDQ8203911.1 VanZ family protein [Pelagicoccus sp. SDUM812003]
MGNGSRSKTLLYLAGSLLSLGVLGFSIWLIHEANIGRDNILFQTVRATPYGDKIGHFLLAGVLTLAANFALRNKAARWGPLRLPYGSLVILVLVITEESSQYYLPTRSLDLVDALANFAGIVVFSIPARLLDKRRERKVRADR